MYQHPLFSMALSAVCVAVLAAASPARPAPEPPAPQPPSAYDATERLRELDAAFLRTAALSGKEQVELGRIAAARSLREDVKSFAEHMLDDHGRANRRLADLAASKGFELPDRLDARRQAELDRISRLSGEDFDRAYVSAMVEDHEADVREFQKQSAMAHDVDVQAWVNNTLLALEEHREMIHDIARGIEGIARAPARPASRPVMPSGR